MQYIQVNHYNKVLKGNQVLIDINLELEKGKIYGVMGKNGSGKTMLLRALCGLIRPSSGEVIIDGLVITKDADYPKSCGALIENPGFWEDLTGFECLKLLAGIKKIISDNDIKAWMSRFHLKPEDKKKYKKYSLGMKQKLALIQAFMESPDLILLDEPTNALDDESTDVLRKLIFEEKERGATILIASHNKEEIELLCDEIFYLDTGRLKTKKEG